ncbi:MAG TPA: ABC transporter permease [Gaiellaceae bacterium]|nr:ABC transporter permease [Gaiellaceae bacterium]
MDWKQILLFAILGLGAGSLIAGVAVAVVLTYRGSGIINLATGAIAMLAGYSYWSLKTGTYGVHVPTAAALVITAIFLLGVGLLIEYAVYRPLRTAAPLAKLAASLGVLLVAQAAVSLAFGIGTKPQPPVLPGGTVTVFGSNVPIDRFILPAIILAATLVLSLVYKLSRFGIATRAASENEIGAMLIGLSPNQLALASTLLATFVAGGLGVLAASITQLDPQALPLVVVPALAAALFARFTSFWIACLVGLGIGMLENILYYLQIQSWFPTDHGVAMPGVQPLLVFVLIVIAMFVRGTSLPSRGELVEQRLPLAPRAKRLWPIVLLGSTAAVVALIVFPYDFRQALITSLLATIMCLSVVVITGFVGQISIVQLALAGISGFILSHLATDHGVGFPAGMLIGAVGATVCGLIIAVSALRVRGVSLAVVTLAAAVAIEQFVFLNSTWGGGTSSSPVPEPKLGIDLGPYGPFRGLDGKVPSPVFGFFVLGMVVVLGLYVANLRRSNLGQRMLAVRSNERAAAAAGINVRNVKLAAFGISSFIAGISGALYGYNFSSVTVTRFSALTALSLIALAYVGGVTMVSGALFAGLISVEALFPYALEKWFGIAGNWALLFAGLALIVTLIQNPDGVAGATYRKRQLKKKRRGPGDSRPGELALTEKEL